MGLSLHFILCSLLILLAEIRVWLKYFGTFRLRPSSSFGCRLRPPFLALKASQLAKQHNSKKNLRHRRKRVRAELWLQHHIQQLFRSELPTTSENKIWLKCNPSFNFLQHHFQQQFRRELPASWENEFWLIYNPYKINLKKKFFLSI